VTRILSIVVGAPVLFFFFFLLLDRTDERHAESIHMMANAAAGEAGIAAFKSQSPEGPPWGAGRPTNTRDLHCSEMAGGTCSRSD